MPTDQPRPWTLQAFTERFAAWVDLETIDGRLQRIVADWIDTRAVDPYHGARYEQRSGMWWVKIPHTLHKGDDYVVICSYRINEVEHSVRCDNFGSAPWTV
jgi:hypothetical protein